MNHKLRGLLVIAVVLFAAVNTSFAMSILNSVPAVTGTVLSGDGAPLEGVTVKVEFFGTDKSLIDTDKEVYVIKEFQTTTDAQGQYSFEKTMINLPGIKSKFISAEITFSKEGFDARKLQAVNMRVMGGPAGVFLLGLIDAQGEFDGEGPGIGHSVAHAYKTMKDSKFSRVYKKIIEEEPMRLEATGGSEQQRHAFDEMYND